VIKATLHQEEWISKAPYAIDTQPVATWRCERHNRPTAKQHLVIRMTRCCRHICFVNKATAALLVRSALLADSFATDLLAHTMQAMP
jgi:hypothetical protein